MCVCEKGNHCTAFDQQGVCVCVHATYPAQWEGQILWANEKRTPDGRPPNRSPRGENKVSLFVVLTRFPDDETVAESLSEAGRGGGAKGSFE